MRSLAYERYVDISVFEKIKRISRERQGQIKGREVRSFPDQVLLLY